MHRNIVVTEHFLDSRVENMVEVRYQDCSSWYSHVYTSLKLEQGLDAPYWKEDNENDHSICEKWKGTISLLFSM